MLRQLITFFRGSLQNKDLFLHYGFYLFLVAESIARPFKIKTVIVTVSLANIVLFFLFAFLVYLFLINDDRFTHHGARPRITLSAALVSILYLANFLSLINAVDFSNSLRYSVTLSGLVMLFFVAFFIIDEKRVVKGVLIIIFSTGIFLSLLTIAQAFGFEPTIFGKVTMSDRRVIGGVPMPFPRTIGIFNTYGSYGLWLFPAVAVSSVGFLRSWYKTAIRLVLFITLLILLFGLFIGQSRAVWLGTFVTLLLATTGVVFLWFVKRYLHDISLRKKIFALVGIFVVLGAVLLILSQVSPDLLSRPYRILLNMGRNSWEKRLNLISKSVELFKSHPLLGAGAGAVRHYLPNVLHNVTFFVLSSYGLVGFIPFVLLIFHTAWLYCSVIVHGADEFLRTSALVFFSSFIGMLVTAQFFLGLQDKILWVTIAMAHSLYIINLKKRESIKGSKGSNN